MNPNKTICCDVDDTICFTVNRDYPNSQPNNAVIEKLRQAKELGYEIVLYTARGQGRSNGNIETVKQEVITEVKEFCIKHNVPFDDIIVGKPWARWYVDDRAILPADFVRVDL